MSISAFNHSKQWNYSEMCMVKDQIFGFCKQSEKAFDENRVSSIFVLFFFNQKQRSTQWISENILNFSKRRHLIVNRRWETMGNGYVNFF